MNDFDEKYLTVRYYRRPDGRMSEIDMTNIYPEDIQFFENYVVSMEELTTGDIAVYAYPENGDEEDEVIVFDNGRNCQETMKALRSECEKAFQ